MSPAALQAELRGIEAELRRRQPEFAGALTDAVVAGWLGGARATLGLVGKKTGVSEPSLAGISNAPPGGPLLVGVSGGGPLAEFPSLEAALQKLLNREILTSEEFYAVSAAARQQAFTITADVSTATLDKVRSLLAEQIEGPASRELFADRVAEEVAGLPIAPSHLEHVFRNATNEAYSQGMEKVLDSPLVAEGFPYRAIYPMRDDRVRPEHLALEKAGLNGTNIYNAKDPVWLMFRPPWAWNCRCGWIAVSVETAAALGVAEAKAWLDSGEAPAVFEFVSWPKYNGQLIMPPASWVRAA